MDTLLLDVDQWDLVLDSSGNIAVASQPYSIAQDVASAVRLFRGELYYGDPNRGVPYFRDILGHEPSGTLIRHEIEQAALTVPNVVDATCLVQESGRYLTGQIQVTDTQGTTTVVNLA